MGISFVRVGVILVLVGVCPAWASVIWESATMGPAPAFSGYSLNTNQFLGARFQVTSPVQVSAIGGHLWENSGTGTFFGAIVELSGPTALPTGSPFDLTLVASTTFVAPSLSSDYRTPLSVALATGYYGLIFGAGQLGSSSGVGAMPWNNSDLPGASYFWWNGTTGNWVPGTDTGMRFVVEGPSSEIPEPSTFVLLGTSLLGLALRRRRR